MEILIRCRGLATLLVAGCFGGAVDPAGHPCMSDAECGALVCDPDAQVCVDPEGTTGTVATTTSPSSSSGSSGPGSSSSGTPSTTDDASTGETTESESVSSSGEPGVLGIDAVVPDKGRADLDREVVVSGSGFTSDVAVFFGDGAVEILDVQPDQIAVRVPPDAGAIGPLDVRVELDGDEVTLANGYTRVRAHPTFEAMPVVALFVDEVIPAISDMVAGQFVGDDAVDLVVGTENGADGVAVAAGDGAGDFDVVWEHDDPAISIAPADVNEDGDLDFVTTGPLGVRTYVNDGFDGFILNTFPGQLPFPRGIRVLDADGADGPDVVVRGAFDTGIQVWLNDGTGDLFAPTIYGADEMTSGDILMHPSVGDFTGDGHDDILTPVEAGAAPVHGFALFENDGAGGFLDPVFTDTGMHGRDSVALHVDLGNDDHLDALGLGGITGIFVLAGNGDGTFESSQITWTLPAGAWQIDGADLNCDDATDFVVIDGGASFAVQRGSPGGSFALSTTETFTDEGYNRSLALVDVDGDGLRDILVSRHGVDGTLEIRTFRNTSAE